MNRPRPKTAGYSLTLLFLSGLFSGVWGDPLLRADRTTGLLRSGDAVYRLDSSTLPPAEASCVDKGVSWDCGAAAWDMMDQYLDDPSIECRPLIAIQSTATDFIPVECYGSGKNLNAWLIRSGWALADQKENALFEEEETLAREEQLGIWRGGFEPPSDWRVGHRRIPVTSAH